MKKLIYYTRIIFFTIYLILLFLLIDNLYNSELFVNIYFILNIFYSFIIILSIISKKNIYKTSYSYNLINIGFYIYTFIIYLIVKDVTRLNILTDFVYFRNNYIMLSILLIGLIFYTLSTNLDYNKKE